MFDLSNPQQRERVLVIVAGIALCAIVMLVLPGQFGELTGLDNDRKKWQKDIEELERHAQNKDEIQDRLSAVIGLALPAAPGSPRNTSLAESGYQNWLMDLARNAGIGNVTLQRGRASGIRNIYDKYTYTLSGEGRLDQIAEFLRRFHRTDYLHQMTTVSPRPSSRDPNIFTVSFRIEVLALLSVNSVNVPGANGVATTITDEEREMLATIRNRAILSEYTPPPPTPPPAPSPLPRPPFDHAPFSVVTAIVMVDGKPQCWIHHQTEGRMHHLFEEESFMLGPVRATVKKIEVNAERIHVAAAGGVYTIRLGKSFAQDDEPSYFLTAIVDADGNPWTAESTGEPYCIIVHGAGYYDDNSNLRITLEQARHLLSVEDSFPMAEVVCTVRSIDPIANQIQIEVAGVVYTIRVEGSFSEFGNE